MHLSSASRLILGTVCGLTVVAACHRRPAAREANELDRDRDHDEHVDERHERRDADRREGDDARPELGSGISTGLAVRSIANARCDREQRCKNIGDGEDFISLDACQDRTRADWAEDLNKYECPRGVVQKELDECLEDIRDEDCNSPIDSLKRMVQCNAADICDDGE